MDDLKHMSIAYCMALSATIWMGARPAGYLARVGPAPLRFQAAEKSAEHTVKLPPLVMFDPGVATLEPFGPFPATETSSAPTVVAPAPTPVFTPPSEPQFSPQALFQMFNRNVTNQNVNVALPYDFYPPTAGTIPAPPSKASYQTK